MCGIFGAVGNIDWNTMRGIASQAVRRGPNAFGLCWNTENGIQVKSEAHRMNADKDFKGIVTDAIIGNCRLATSGSYKVIENNQPICGDGFAITHNGNVRDYLQIASELGANLRTECDSEIIWHMVQLLGVDQTIERLNRNGHYAIIILQNNSLTAYRMGQPLFHKQSNGCHYLCSRQFEDAQPIEEGKVLVFGGEEPCR